MFSTFEWEMFSNSNSGAFWIATLYAATSLCGLIAVVRGCGGQGSSFLRPRYAAPVNAHEWAGAVDSASALRGASSSGRAGVG